MNKDKTTVFDTLHNTNVGTGREKQWSIRVQMNPDNSCSIITEHGMVHGNKVVHEKTITCGKNIGRKNETTVLQQALLEAQSEFNKKVRQGYSTNNTSTNNTSSTNNTYSTNNTSNNKTHSKCIKPMLAQEFELHCGAGHQVFIQPKLDGVRCLVYYSHMDDSLVFQSRQNTIYEPFEHLEPSLHSIFAFLSNTLNTDKHNIVLDGELYIHQKGFNTITSVVRKSKTSASKKSHQTSRHELEYHIYDCLLTENTNAPYSFRYSVLSEAFQQPLNHVKLVATTISSTCKEDIMRIHQMFVEDGYEGIMIRNMNGPYKQQSRSKDLLKYKTFQDEEFIVTGFHEGTGCHTGTPVFECVTSDNKTFSVTFADTIEQKKQMMQHVNDYIGQRLTVKFQELSPDGIPRFPVGIAFRTYE